MTRLTAGKKTRKKQSEFQRLWAKAEKLKQENARFRDRLDMIIRRIENDIRPVEAAAARQQLPLLKRLLTLGQRKSLTQWQRRTLDGWIRELLEPLQGAGNLDSDVLDDICRYDAFRLGFELDETASTPLTEQMRGFFEQAEEKQQQEDQTEDEAWRQEIHHEVETILDKTFGPEPPRPGHAGIDSDDLFQDELKIEQQRQYDSYHKARNAAREELLEEMLADADFYDDEEEDDFDFDFGFDPFGASQAPSPNSSDDTPSISNAVFKRLFRYTAAKLHPDREHNPDMREKKHTLMTKLLNARKQGDVMTIVQMYQEHTGDDTALSKADEKQLIKSLQRQVDELQCEKEEYSFESPAHRMAFELFYYPSLKKTDQAFQKYIQQMKKAAADASSLALNIKSIKTLKPYLEQRYDESRYFNTMEALDAFFEFAR